MRNYDYVGRYGGEEFLIVLAECPASDLIATAERMRAAYRESRLKPRPGPFR